MQVTAERRHAFTTTTLPLDTTQSSAQQSVWTLGLLFLAGAALAAGLYATTVYIVNPVRDFPGSSSFPAVRSDYRNEKIVLFDAFAQQGPVDGLILGSSRSMLLNGERLREISNGRRYFNFGLASAKGEDFLAALRFVASRRQQPKHVIIGVDVESLRDARAHGDSIHPLRELATGKPGRLDHLRTIFERTATWSYALDTAQSIYLRLAPRKPAVGFTADGTLQYLGRDAQRAAGTFRLEQGMAGCVAGCRKKIEDTTDLSQVQIGYLREAIREAEASGAQVTLWLTGPHPRAAEHMASGTAYPQLVDRTWQLLREEKTATVLDLHDERFYGGDPNGWYDCNHFDNSHARIVEQILLKKSPASLAVHNPKPERGL